MIRRALLLAMVSATALVLAACSNGGSDQVAVDPAFVAELMVAGPLEEHWLGDEAAPVTVIEYASMTCPHCRSFHVTVFDDFVEEFVDTGEVRFLLREFSLDQRTQAGFILARCAPGENAYYALIDHLFETQDAWAFVEPELFLETLFGQVQQAGFSQESFEACLANQELLDGIVAVFDRGVELGVNSTPTFFVNGRSYPGALSLDQLRGAVLAAR